MLVDAWTIPSDTVLKTDICIMGAGAAGITLAREFIGQSFRVSVLEGGGLEYDSETQSLYKGENTGIPYFRLDGARLRHFGGTTGHWGGYCFPLRDSDFETREWIPFSGWPLTRSELLPYYERAYPICRIPSPEWELAYWEQQEQVPPFPLTGSRITNRFALMVPKSQRHFGTN